MRVVILDLPNEEPKHLTVGGLRLSMKSIIQFASEPIPEGYVVIAIQGEEDDDF